MVKVYFFHCVILVFIFLNMIISPMVHAMPEDSKKVAKLLADSADLNQNTHRGEYIGHVEFDQGTTHLRAAKAITKGNEKNKLILAIVLGSKEMQAHYWTQTATDKPLLHAYADMIRYYPQRHLCVLIGNARVYQGKNSFSAPSISYDTKKQHILSKSKGQKRINIIIHPEEQ